MTRRTRQDRTETAAPATATPAEPPVDLPAEAETDARDVAARAKATSSQPMGQALGQATGPRSGTPPPSTEATPSMAQFLEIKAANPDSILWYRMGDFYELFFEDAVVAAQALGIVLTKRGKHLGEDIPMCGVPVHRADEYLQRLIRKGYRVAVCEQLEDPAEARKRGAKAVVRRDVVRLVTPGTLTEETLLEAGRRNYLTALFLAPPTTGGADASGAGRVAALASLDISTGELEVGEVAAGDLPGELTRLAPGEIIAGDATFGDPHAAQAVTMSGAAATPVPQSSFDSLSGERGLKTHLGVTELAGFGDFTRAELAAVGALLRYVELTQLGRRPVIRPPRRVGSGAILTIDAASRASLELVRTTSGEKAGSLLGAVDLTVTGPGARELAGRLASPLRDVRRIAARLDAVGFLIADDDARETLRLDLRRVPDIARAVARLAFARGGPRDLLAVRDGLAAAADCRARLATAGGAIGLPEDLAAIAARLGAASAALTAELAAAIIDDPPHLKRDGGFVRPGYSADLEAARALRDDSRKVMAGLEQRYIEASGVKSLKVRHNNILGFFVEVTQANAKPLLSEPLAVVFRHRQTMANAVRFTTGELVEIEGRIASAAERALAIEQEVFQTLCERIAAEEAALGDVAAALADLDVTAALAELARREGFVRPIVDAGTAFEIRGGRHPVVEQALRAARAGPFIENDCVLAKGAPEADAYPTTEAEAVRSGPTGFEEVAGARLWLVTGPNMAGKSTYLRQNALIAVLAQAGSFVPARFAHIGALDRLFSRVGAADDLARGRSTFMVEMVETAGILNQASERSLVILDEIGRGTATFDGLSIAWACVEYLHEVCRSRTLFATHYHELTALAGRLPEVANVTIDVKEWHDEIVFLHKVKPGAADRSYGIQVAKLAGLPAPVVARAGEVLAKLEKGEAGPGGGRGKPSGALEDLPLFAAARPQSVVPRATAPSVVETALADIRPDELTPRQALDALYRLKDLVTPRAKIAE